MGIKEIKGSMGEIKELTEKLFNSWEGTIKTLVEKVVEEGKLSGSEGKKLLKEYTSQFKGDKEKLEKLFESEMNKAIKNVLQPTRKRLEEVTSKIAALEEELKDIKK